VPDKKKPKRTVHRVDPSRIIIQTELREEMDAEAIASALLDILPLLDVKTRAELAEKGKKIREEMDSKSSKKTKDMV
jgi:hypothetical protein